MKDNSTKWEKIENDGALTYYLQLGHEEWNKKRKEIYKRDNYKCQLCDNGNQILNVHHKRYIDGLKAWEYPNNLLITLCKDCHAKFHNKHISQQSGYKKKKHKVKPKAHKKYKPNK